MPLVFNNQKVTILVHQSSHPGESVCSDGHALVPDSVSMTSMRKRHQGPDKCADANFDTVCTTKKKPYSTITLDFGRPVEIAKVDFKLIEPRIFLTLSSAF